MFEGGIEALTKYLESSITNTVTVDSNYQIAIDPLTKLEYRIYDNGTVYREDDTFITDEGVEGLYRFLQNRMQTKHIKGKQYNIAVDSNTKYEYKVWENGNVTTMEDKYVTKGGIVGLQKYLQAKAEEAAEDSEFQLAVDPNTGHEYRIFKNGTVMNEDGITVARKGMKGLMNYLTSSLHTIVVENEPWNEAIDPDTNEKYIVHDNGTTYHENGTFITHRGVLGVKDYIDHMKSLASGEEISDDKY